MAPAPKIVFADPQSWRQGFLNLRPSVMPCLDLTMQSWAGLHEKCVDFLDRWADEVAGLGWTASQLIPGGTTNRELAFLPNYFIEAIELDL